MLKFTFDQTYGLVPGSIPTCSANYGLQGAVQCVVDADGKTIIMTGGFPSTDFLIIVSINGLKNPSHVRYWYTFVASYQSNGLPIELSGATNFSFRTTPGALSCKLSNLGSDVVAEYTDISVLCIVSNEVELAGYFEIGMAKWNSGTPNIGLERSMIKYNELQFQVTPLGVQYAVACSSAEHPNISCSIQPAAVTTVEQISQGRDIFRVKGLTRPILSGQAFNFRTSGLVFKNPPTTKEISTFKASSYRADGSMIDEQTQGIKYQISTPTVILANQVQIRAATGEINQQQAFDF